MKTISEMMQSTTIDAKGRVHESNGAGLFRCTGQFSCRGFSAMGLSLALLSSVADAGSRRFGYSYEATTMPQGAMELENIVTWKTDKSTDPDFERFDIRNEFEYGVTDRLQVAFYFADVRYEENSSESGVLKFHDVALEVIYNLQDPATNPLGSAIYGEVKGSDDFIELEGKLLLQKNAGPLMFVYNIGGAIEWEDNYEEDVAELMQSAGVSYSFSPAWSVGAEVLHEIEVPDVESFGDQVVYAGPNVSWHGEHFSVLLSGMWQLTSVDGEADFQMRSILSFDF